MTTKIADISTGTLRKALGILRTEIIPSLNKLPDLKSSADKLMIMDSRLSSALENARGEMLEGVHGQYLEGIAKTILALRQKLTRPTLNPDEESHVASVKQVVASLPTPKQFHRAFESGSCYGCESPSTIHNESGDWCDDCWKALCYDASEGNEDFWRDERSSFGEDEAYGKAYDMEEGDLLHTGSNKNAAEAAALEKLPDTTKVLGVPGEDPDARNYFDHRDLARKFYSQMFESAVMIASDGCMYQVLQILNLSGNFVLMLQDVLHPQIVFTINANDLMAHIYKWISPFDVVVNPGLAPMTAQSISEIVSVGDLKKPEVPEQWLSY